MRERVNAEVESIVDNVVAGIDEHAGDNSDGPPLDVVVAPLDMQAVDEVAARAIKDIRVIHHVMALLGVGGHYHAISKSRTCVILPVEIIAPMVGEGTVAGPGAKSRHHAIFERLQ